MEINVFAPQPVRTGKKTQCPQYAMDYSVEAVSGVGKTKKKKEGRLLFPNCLMDLQEDELLEIVTDLMLKISRKEVDK